MGKIATIKIADQQPPLVVTSIRYCLYARKSTESDELQALSIDSQIKEMLAMAKKGKMEVVEIRKESHSAKDSSQRPVFNQIIEDIKSGLFNGILTWAPDRLSRNAGDLGSLVDLMDQGRLIEIRTYGQRFTNSPNEKFLLMILCSQAKLENDHKGENVKRGLRAKCEMGWRPGMAPLGYLHDKFAKKGQKRVLLDSERAPVIKQMFEKVAFEGTSGRNLLNWLNKEVNFTTRTGKRIVLSRIYLILKDSFYYGEFEYPLGSNKWYKGGHDPIITKELFLKAQAELLVPPRRHPGTNDFEFTRLLYCGSCGSGICAEEKFKHQKNGTTHRYVYYHCTKGKDRNCKEKAIREEELLNQLLRLIDKIDIDEIGTKEKIIQEVQRYRKFSYGVLNQEADYNQRPINVDIRNYAKYILTEGSKEEKRELLSCLRSRLEIKEKTVYLKFQGKESLEK
jgi:DNA invertase Pin-like site-specific DNA recombinase